MKNFILSIFLFSFIWSCTSSSTTTESSNTVVSSIDTTKIDADALIKALTQEFQFYSADKLDLQNILKVFGNGQVQSLPIPEVREFFTHRDSLHSSIDKIVDLNEKFKTLNFKQFGRSYTIKELLSYCEGDTAGYILISYGLNNIKQNNLNFQISRTAKLNNIDLQPKLESGSLLSGTESVNYENFRKDLISKKIVEYNNFSTKPFTIFTKKSMLSILVFYLKELKLNENTPFYFYYGYSDYNGKKHPSVLFSTKGDLETNPTLAEANSKNYAFANRGGLCCPPQY